MQRIQTLLKKIDDLAKKGEKLDLIELDLMLDYTKVVYADLMEVRSNKVYVGTPEPQPEPMPTPPKPSIEPEVKVTPPDTPEIKEPVPPRSEKTEQEEPKVSIKGEDANTPKPVIQEVDVPEQGNPQPIPQEKKNINKVIGINDKYQYISELFNSDKEAYEAVLNTINEFNTADEAIDWLETEVSKEQNWDGELLSVQMFYDTVNTFFSSK